jgi:hypothetical protein
MPSPLLPPPPPPLSMPPPIPSGFMGGLGGTPSPPYGGGIGPGLGGIGAGLAAGGLPILAGNPFAAAAAATMSGHLHPGPGSYEQHSEGYVADMGFGAFAQGGGLGGPYMSGESEDGFGGTAIHMQQQLSQRPAHQRAPDLWDA